MNVVWTLVVNCVSDFAFCFCLVGCSVCWNRQTDLVPWDGEGGLSSSRQVVLHDEIGGRQMATSGRCRIARCDEKHQIDCIKYKYLVRMST